MTGSGLAYVATMGRKRTVAQGGNGPWSSAWHREGSLRTARQGRRWCEAGPMPDVARLGGSLRHWPSGKPSKGMGGNDGQRRESCPPGVCWNRLSACSRQCSSRWRPPVTCVDTASSMVDGHVRNVMPLFHRDIRSRRRPLKGAKPPSRKPSAFSGVPRHALKPKVSLSAAPSNSSQRPLPASSLRSAPTTLSRRRGFNRASKAMHSWDQELARLRHRLEELEGQNGKLIDALKDTVSICDGLLASARDGEAAELQGPAAILGSATANALPEEKHGVGRRIKEMIIWYCVEHFSRKTLDEPMLSWKGYTSPNEDARSHFLRTHPYKLVRTWPRPTLRWRWLSRRPLGWLRAPHFLSAGTSGGRWQQAFGPSVIEPLELPHEASDLPARAAPLRHAQASQRRTAQQSLRSPAQGEGRKRGNATLATPTAG